jgi:hypothetical protein
MAELITYPLPFEECIKCGTDNPEVLTADHRWPEFLLGIASERKRPFTQNFPLFGVVNMIENQLPLCLKDHCSEDKRKYLAFLGKDMCTVDKCPKLDGFLDENLVCSVSNYCNGLSLSEENEMKRGKKNGKPLMRDVKRRGNPIALAQLITCEYPETKNPRLLPIQLDRMQLVDEAYINAVKKLNQEADPSIKLSDELKAMYIESAHLVADHLQRLKDRKTAKLFPVTIPQNSVLFVPSPSESRYSYAGSV